jgi:iron complex outermembrane receptor protein
LSCTTAGSLLLGLNSGAAEGGIEEIVVTAQKREESIQEVPIAITAVSGEQMDNMHATTLESLQGYIPNVQIQPFANTPHGAVFNIRGMGVIEPDPYAGNTVSVVVDGVPQFFNMVALLDTFDIERIEVLRGPQGTLFGANSTGGVINVVTRQPTGEFGGNVEFTMGDWDRIDFKGAVDFPIGEQLAGKLVYSHVQRDGWHTNVVNGNDMGSKEVDAFRGYLKHDSDSFDATLIGEYVRSRNGSPIVVSGSLPGEALYVQEGFQNMYESRCLPAGSRCTAPSKYLAANDSTDDVSDMDTYSATLTMNWDSSIGTITSITGFKHFELYELTDQDGTVVFGDDTERETEGWQFTQEIRNSFEPSENVQVVAGAYLMVNNYDHYQDFRFPFNVPGLRQLTEQDQDNWSVSAFAQANFDVSDTVRLRAGLRYTVEETDMDVTISLFENFAAGEIEYGGGNLFAVQVAERRDEKWNEFGWDLGLDWTPNDNLLGYLSYKRGFKSGGFVGRLAIADDIGPYDPEFVDTVEVGIKSDWMDNRLRLNLNVFYNWYDDIQLPQIYFTTDDFGNQINGNSILNAAAATTWGVETEITAVPASGLTLFASMGYLDATYDDFPLALPAGGVLDMSGQPLQNSPEWTISAGVNYDFRVGNGNAVFNAVFKYVDTKFNNGLDNAPRVFIQSTETVDANLEWTPDEGSWTVGLWATNLFDQRNVASVFDAPGVLAIVNYAAPREYGASVKYRF